MDSAIVSTALILSGRPHLIGSNTSTVADFAAAYRETYEHLQPILLELRPEQLATRVPFSPEWSVLDVVAHMASEAHALVGEDLPEELFDVSEAGRDSRAEAINAWNADQLARRRASSLGQLLAEWSSDLPALLEALVGSRSFHSTYPGAPYVAVVDLAMHAQDIRNLLGRPGDRESAGVGLALPAFGAVVALRLQEVGLPALALSYGEKSRLLGDGEPGATVMADRYELVRALASRRSTAQIRAYNWDGDPEPYLPIIPAYQPRDDDIVE
jgi:uncharacterized protein (TIGR03083 family)